MPEIEYLVQNNLIILQLLKQVDIIGQFALFNGKILYNIIANSYKMENSMEIIEAKYAGMCGGVKYTVTMANKILDEHPGKKIYCLGELVHNKTVVNSLENKGLVVVQDINDVPDNNIVIFRAHGVTKDNYKIAENKNLEVFDLTCKNVINIHKEVENKEDCFIIIIGSKTHAESVATLSFAGENAVIIESEDDFEQTYEKIKKSKLNSVFIVAQTTYSSKKFDDMIDKISDDLTSIGIEVKYDKTICMATEIRQNEADELSKQADYVVIIGGKNSSNTKKLYEIASKNCSSVQFIENENELNLSQIKSSNFEKILLLAGASTPDESINATKEKILSIN